MSEGGAPIFHFSARIFPSQTMTPSQEFGKILELYGHIIHDTSMLFALEPRKKKSPWKVVVLTTKNINELNIIGRCKCEVVVVVHIMCIYLMRNMNMK